MFPPQRIVCLTEETVETLYLLGEEHRIVGISGYAVRPPRARREKPRVSAFTSADIPKILDLNPDLVLTFSDLQAEIAATLIRHGVGVHAFNQRTVAEILDMIRTLGALVGAGDRAARLADELAAALAPARQRAAQLPRRPKGLFRGMGRSDDLRHRLGLRTDRGCRRRRYLCRSCAARKSAKDRIVTAERDHRGVRRISSSAPGAARNFGPRRSPHDPGFDRVPAVQRGAVSRSNRR